MKWISLKDKLPNEKEHGNKVLLYRAEVMPSQKAMEISIFNTHMIKHCDKETTYWMELPKPPKVFKNGDIVVWGGSKSCIGIIKDSKNDEFVSGGISYVIDDITHNSLSPLYLRFATEEEIEMLGDNHILLLE